MKNNERPREAPRHFEERRRSKVPWWFTLLVIIGLMWAFGLLPELPWEGIREAPKPPPFAPIPGRTCPPIKAVIVVDVSPSMGEVFRAEIEAAATLTQYLTEKDLVGVVAFSSDAWGTALASPNEAYNFLWAQSPVGRGGTNIAQGIDKAIEILQGDPNSYIILFTDGGYNRGGDPRITATKFPGHLIVAGYKTEETLPEILNGMGTTYYAPNYEKLKDIARQIALTAGCP